MPRGEVAAHAFVADVDAPELDPGDRHHLERALRLRPGEQLTVADGKGRWRLCRFGRELEPEGPVEVEEAPSPPITLAVALTKRMRLDWAVQKATEVGVDRLVLFEALRSVARWDEARALSHVERLRRVAREAAMQSRRVFLPVVEGLTSFADVARRPGATLAHPGGGPPHPDRPVLLVGPEGGWAAQELECGLPRTSLGPHVLRSETAALAGAVLLVAVRSSLSAPNPHGGGVGEGDC